jgi:hypothetical protein
MSFSVSILGLLLGLILISNSGVFAAEGDDAASGGEESIGQVKDSLQIREDSLMGKILEDEEMKPIVDGCRTSNNDTAQKFQKCIEDEMEKPQYAVLLADLQKKYLDKDGKENKHQPIALSNLKRTDSAAMRKLEEYLTKRLEEALYGEIKKDSENKKQRMVDHTTFLKLYQSQISKNIIATVSSFCMEVCTKEETINGKKSWSLNGYGSNCRKENLTKLSTISEDGTTSKAYQGWNRCLVEIPSICSTGGGLSNHPNRPAGESPTPRDHACQVTDAMKGMRLNLMQLSEIDKRFNEIKSSNKRSRVMIEKEDAGQRERYVGESKGDSKSIDDLTTVTSNELINESGYGKAVEKESEKMQTDCIETLEDEECKKYLHSDEDVAKLEDAATEYNLRRQVALNKMEEIEDQDELVTFLKEEGRGEAEIQKMLDEQGYEKLKAAITAQFKAEKKAVISALNKKISDRSIEDKKPAAGGPPPPVEDTKVKKLTEIKKEMDEKPKGYQELVHFNNIISGFLEIESTANGKSEKMANTHSLFRELNDNVYQSNGRDVASDAGGQPPAPDAYGSSNLDALRGAVESAGLKDQESKPGETGKEISVEVINENILRYE